jgi:hypothetical protein
MRYFYPIMTIFSDENVALRPTGHPPFGSANVYKSWRSTSNKNTSAIVFYSRYGCFKIKNVQQSNIMAIRFKQVFKVVNCKFQNVMNYAFLCLNTRSTCISLNNQVQGKSSSHRYIHMNYYTLKMLYTILLFTELLFVPLRIFHSHWRISIAG